MFERSDETLVKQALNGKKSAWITLVKRYEKNLYNYTLRMVSNPDDAMDLMQDVFMAVFRNLAIRFTKNLQFLNSKGLKPKSVRKYPHEWVNS